MIEQDYGQLTLFQEDFPVSLTVLLENVMRLMTAAIYGGELFRVFCDIGAKWLVAENVFGLLSSENGQFFGRVLWDLASGGYNAWWYCFPAKVTGAPFKGNRVFIVASSNSIGRGSMVKKQAIKPDDKYLEMLGKWKTRQINILSYPKRTKPGTGSGIERNDDGISEGMDRLKCLGNAIVPQQLYPIFKAIAEIEACSPDCMEG